MTNYAVTTKILTHNRPSGDADSVTNIDGDKSSLAKLITDYLETVTDSFTIHYIGVSVDHGVAYATIVHNNA